MSVLSKAARRARSSVRETNCAADFGLNLIEARRLYDVWREHQTWPSLQIARAATEGHYRYHQGFSAYVHANRAKWRSFCAQASKLRRAGELPIQQRAAEIRRNMPVDRPFERHPLESTQQAKLIGLCKAQGWWAYKTEAPGMAGIPDLQILNPAVPMSIEDPPRKRSRCIHHGRIAFVEMKRPGEKPTKLQRHLIRELTTMGFVAFWSDNPVEAFERLRELWKVLG